MFFNILHLGIILDTVNMECRLPIDKLEQIKEFISQFLHKKCLTKREALQLLGHFNFAARVILPGRAFTSFLIGTTTKVSKLHHHIRLNHEAREDLLMWYKFLCNWNRVSMFHNKTLISSADIELFTNASSNFGFGGYFQGEWFSASWPYDINLFKSNKIVSMTFRELYPIVVASVIWGNRWKGLKILFNCDNMAVVNILNKGRSSDPASSKLMRTLAFTAAQNSFMIYSRFVPGNSNVIADALSRFQLQRFHRAAPQAQEQSVVVPHMSSIVWQN
ncbi:hypothetical protein SNE40_009550 [Patella caerulea]|uniref:Reverse transcriptase RNase H-like domain-containing protein n=1 Tax=Patella caerulea TaxID=87958 RepID=A0AAN8JSE9_PATCE